MRSRRGLLGVAHTDTECQIGPRHGYNMHTQPCAETNFRNACRCAHEARDRGTHQSNGANNGLGVLEKAKMS